MSVLPPPVGKLLKAALRLFRLLYQQMLLFFLLYNVINLVVFGPLVALLLDRFVSASGDRAIANFDIAGYLLSPAGMGFLMAAGVAAVVLLMLEMSGFMLLGQAALEGERLSTSQLLPRLWSKLVPVLGLSSIAIVGLLLAALPIAGLALLIKSLLLGQHDINYYLTLKPPEFWLAAVLGALLAIIALVLFTAISIIAAFTLPHVLFGDRT
ncbi:MAG: glycerophosphoryl diester phosphodiesterase membrane domain-containing protein, partial [Pseudomonadota bacterium]|nr:glycerophosphoryl diester phosphodiesterase membrane domain-containing protein [Pseudomonadota bacterium]